MIQADRRAELEVAAGRHSGRHSEGVILGITPVSSRCFISFDKSEPVWNPAAGLWVVRPKATLFRGI